MMKWRSCPVAREAPSLTRCSYQPGQRTFSDTETRRESLAKSPCEMADKMWLAAMDFFFRSKENKINCWRKKNTRPCQTMRVNTVMRFDCFYEFQPSVHKGCTVKNKKKTISLDGWTEDKANRLFTIDDENLWTESFSTLTLCIEDNAPLRNQGLRMEYCGRNANDWGATCRKACE